MPGNFEAKSQVGKKVLLAQSLWAGGDKKLPKGLVLDAVGFGSALHLQTEPCSACGVSLYIANVPKRYLEAYGAPDSKTPPEYPAIARWEPDPDNQDMVLCSRCQFRSKTGLGAQYAVSPDRVSIKWKFCPGCGAGIAVSDRIDLDNDA